MNTKFGLGLLTLMVALTALPNGLLAEDRPPVQIQLVNPPFPPEMSKKGISGAVLVEFIIDQYGFVPRAQALRSTDRRFEAAAVQAVRLWRFQPGERDGRKVNVRASQLIEFNLDAVAVYPKSLLVGQVEGSATVEYLIDTHGRAVQTRVTSATSPELGYAAQAAIEDTSFAPPFKDSPAGKPRQTTLTFAVNGKSDAPVDPWIKSHLEQLKQEGTFPTANMLSKPLVRKLHPQAVYPRSIPSDIRAGKAVVEFIVDREGKVHVPRIVSSSREEFGYSAVQAVGNWTYEPFPAAVKGDGILVTETFDFVSPAENRK